MSHKTGFYSRRNGMAGLFAVLPVFPPPIHTAGAPPLAVVLTLTGSPPRCGAPAFPSQYFTTLPPLVFSLLSPCGEGVFFRLNLGRQGINYHGNGSTGKECNTLENGGEMPHYRREMRVISEGFVNCFLYISIERSNNLYRRETFLCSRSTYTDPCFLLGS